MCQTIETKFLSLCVCNSIVSWHILESSMFIRWCQVWPGFNVCFCLFFQVYEQPVLLLLIWWPVMTLILPTLPESCDVTTFFMFLRPPCIIISGDISNVCWLCLKPFFWSGNFTYFEMSFILRVQRWLNQALILVLPFLAFWTLGPGSWWNYCLVTFSWLLMCIMPLLSKVL